MANNIRLWNLTQTVQLQTDIKESIKKISNIDNHLYIQTTSNCLYHGIVQTSENSSSLTLDYCEDWKVIDLDCCKDSLYVVDIDGNVYKCTKNLEKCSEICLLEDYQCSRGHTGTKCKMKVSKIAVGEYGQLFVTDWGHLWAMGHMPQIGINSDTPRKVNFFNGRTVHSVNVGNDFAIAIVSKQMKSDDTDSDEEDVFVSNCPQCLSASQLTSPASQTSFSDLCPLGNKIQGSYDIETTSTSSKNDSSVSSDRRLVHSDDEEEKHDKQKVEKNIIFRNTEAAKEFLTRQISRMSSAGEEYLVECTEKPTRIIKENMTNVASFVYEGVKTVGDKVVTLSRHVSGSSDCNSTMDPNPDLTVPRSASKDDGVCSLSQCTSEKDLSEGEIKDRVANIVKSGSELINCEVWTWGNIIHGQLDCRHLEPNDCLNNPIRQFLHKFVEAGADKPTGIGDIIKRERPMIITKLSNIGVRKVSVQNYHAAVLTLDGRAYIWGRNDHNQVTMDTNMDQSSPKLYNMSKDERVKDVVCGAYYTAVLNHNLNLSYFGKGASKCVDLYCIEGHHEVKEPIVLFRNLLSSMQYTVLNVGSSGDNFFANFLLEEQKFLEEMLIVQSTVIKPLQKKNINTANAGLYEDLCKSYMDLCYFWAANVQSLLEHCNGLISLCDIVMFRYLDEFIFVYKNYISTIFNVISIDGFLNISKLIEISPNLYKQRPDSFTKKEKNNEENIISTYLLAPLDKLETYTTTFDNYSNQLSFVPKWSDFVDEQLHKKQQAEQTRAFWLNSGKVVDQLKSPDRRLIRDSHKYPIHLQNASRFSSHWFVLFSDLFVHMNGSTAHLHNLTTIWIEPQQDETSQQYQICLKMPEETLVLCTSEPEAKIEWFHALQNAIKAAMNKSEALQPPVVRNGSYVFRSNGFFKDGTYTGRWSNGKMQGNGKVQWSDGKAYNGQFCNNQLCGYGVMEIPSVGIYEGQWKDNQQNGFGVFTYNNTDVYKGHFKDGQPHGHGFLRKGNFMANAASFYIGDWVNGMKNGYGVMDDIANGEKYIGNWMDNKKHGNGLIITSDGIYYEGIFNQDVLTGQGVMILEDGTRYEGEFRGTGILYGKGTLTLPSGHTIEGNLSGPWDEGIKISNGTLFRTLEKTPAKTFCSPVHQKWKALFKQCHQILGVPEKNGAKSLDTQKIWQNVAVYLSNSNSMKRTKNDKKFHNSLNNLDIIPPFGREKLDLETYTEVKSYLSKAFESNFHPLGSLLTDLSEAYTTTYGGRAHPLLLGHAIAELHYICKRLYEIVRFLFPALPPYDKESLVENEDSEEIVNYQSLLYPLILPKVHHPLFTLFTLKNEQQERQYKRTLMEWNKQSDTALMTFLSVDQKFFHSEDQQIAHIFEDAIETLQQLKTTFSPTEKLLVIRQTVEKMTPVAQELLGVNYVWNMDDLFPIFLFVVVRARIPDLGSELDFVDNFMDPSLESGELGIMYTTLKASYQQILQEKVSSY
ncbi:alsin isoform X1 [Tribolium castaneum]|uniref:Alsin-like Protein n=1 Tax=Tribolium castaneum TaxID=7070 RepID=D6WJR6_TRICA|nr:PREDICTED: alsin isoform X2 [Tribolium castaneum]EFA04485.1 Alsin-like Protein [Tribolium castaneum]|eukprot:XP_001811806.2 PREDICTED: alsin isoform X2 [Tribolium castaneum]